MWQWQESNELICKVKWISHWQKMQWNLVDNLLSHKFVMLLSTIYLIWKWTELQKEQLELRVHESCLLWVQYIRRRLALRSTKEVIQFDSKFLIYIESTINCPQIGTHFKRRSYRFWNLHPLKKKHGHNLDMNPFIS